MFDDEREIPEAILVSAEVMRLNHNSINLVMRLLVKYGVPFTTATIDVNGTTQGVWFIPTGPVLRVVASEFQNDLIEVKEEVGLIQID